MVTHKKVKPVSLCMRRREKVGESQVEKKKKKTELKLRKKNISNPTTMGKPAKGRC
jgi:hypothetical protein